MQEDRIVKDQHVLERITLNPKVMTGKPVIRGTRLTVEYILKETRLEKVIFCLFDEKTLEFFEAALSKFHI